MKRTIKKLPLHDIHLGLSAKMGEFAGWQVPLFYSSIVSEYKQCRERAVVFDISHMGEFIFQGDIKNSGIEKAVTPCLEEIPLGRSGYGFILNDSGGVVDDLIVFKISPDKLMFVVNASSEDKDYQVLKEAVKGPKIENISAETAKIDLQGPLSKEVLSESLGFNQELAYFAFTEFNYKGEKILISRTGYTGELGYEIFLPKKSSVSVWNQLLDNQKVKPAGFGARDMLRLEMGYSLLGHELKEDITPLQAGLAKFINFDKDFIGKDALLSQKDKGIKKVKIAFSLNSKRIPRPGYKIYSADKRIGEVTSGTYSFLLSAGIGLGYINSDYQQKIKKIFIEDEKRKKFEAKIVQLPFYKKGSARN
ncbi:MAG: glycine cleavage system aminomethyltransferase GcvT [Candidatus Omnitrophica bacterium]|nr:glycine cleavage system aminomethyltransferase GcvT [Candidatus Omnitrophota bacterium]MCF7878324.1 glycine cleavage system aminomethyltransferase GcvT [Candidatus Omnitrophota bacterium]